MIGIVNTFLQVLFAGGYFLAGMAAMLFSLRESKMTEVMELRKIPLPL